MRVIVQVAKNVSEDRDPARRRELDQQISPYILEPLHPGTTERSLASWFRVDVPTPLEAESIASRLRDLDGVEAAYVEPHSAPPG
jgi:hypothetical protein